MDIVSIINDNTNIILSVANIILVIVVGYQAYIMRKTFVSEIEKEKRIQTISFLSSFLRNFDKNLIVARTILKELKKEDIEKIKNLSEVDISGYTDEKKEKIFTLMRIISDKEIDNMDKIDLYHVAKIRYSMSDYLNTLEIILLGWDLSIVDKEIYKKEFNYLIEGEDCILKDILNVFDPNRISFPAIYKFCDYLKNEKKDTNPSKKDIK